MTDSRKVAILKNITDENIEYEKVIVDLAFAYKEDAIEEEPDKFIISYGNTIKTYTGGAHIDGLKEGLVKYFKRRSFLSSEREIGSSNFSVRYHHWTMWFRNCESSQARV